jgi:S-disulfanyl-L-cysteine oxidoreductase SoxD
MFSLHKSRLWACVAAMVWLALGISGAAQAGAAYPGIGRVATLREMAAWDIDVRPDFKGLPPGSGSVAQGMDIWETKCASCHGVFGESNQTFSPLVGGTTAQDMQTGHAARLKDRAFPARTTLMKVSTLSTLWDYINRAMPWTAPKSLKPDEVYAVLAYLLNLGGVVPDDLVLSNTNIADVQKRLPNRNGTTTDHGMWPGRLMGNGGKADVSSVACMSNCAGDTTIASSLPDYARNAHGNLAAQNRLIGAQHGVDTTRASAVSLASAREAAAAAPASAPVAKPATATPMALLQNHACLACHSLDSPLVGPAFSEVSKKYADRKDAVAYLAGKVLAGGTGVWGSITMPAQSLKAEDAQLIAQWIADGLPR